MALDAAQVRSHVEELLHKDKSLTEKEVKADVAKAFKVSVQDVGAGVIRDVRKSMGIDRPSAIDHAKAMLARDPRVDAKTVVETIANRFGIRLGPPDVSRLRPKDAKAARGAKKTQPARAAAKPRRRGRGATAPAAASAAPAAPARRRGRPRKAQAATPAPSAAATPRRRRVRKPAAAPASAASKASTSPTGRGGEITMTFEGKGTASDLAAFFRSISSQG